MVSQVVATDQCSFLILPLLLLIASVLVTIGSVRSCLGMPLMTVDGVLGNLLSDLDECIRKHLWPNLPQLDSGLPNVTVVY